MAMPRTVLWRTMLLLSGWWRGVGERRRKKRMLALVNVLYDCLAFVGFAVLFYNFINGVKHVL